MNLSDINHYVGADISATISGDLAPITTTIRGQQRLLRRLLTNPGEYKFHPTYGAGLPGFIGQTANIPQITAVIRGQMLVEDAVAQLPAPTISVKAINRASGGGISVAIGYVDSPTGQPVTLNFNVSN